MTFCSCCAPRAPVVALLSPVAVESATPVSRDRRRTLFALLAVGCAGAALAVAPALMPGRVSQVEASIAPVSPIVSAAAESSPTPIALAEAARRQLGSFLVDPSPRLRFLAAIGLSRVRDPEAIEALAAVMTGDPSPQRRLEAGYALARAGRPAGEEALRGALQARQRYVRLEAARSLARLGDAHGAKLLREAMRQPPSRLGAAEALVWLGDVEARAILREALGAKDRGSRLRAAVALGRVGDTAAREALRGAVADGQAADPGVAAALTLLGDDAGALALESALARTALRVEAALALHRAGFSPRVSGLALALARGDALARISAAEAILVLADPEAVSELP